jgi:S-adenosylmethionine:tRNA ribosyltransferase-isomerase
VSAPAFQLPHALEATAPPEARGLVRDEVRLMVARRATGRIEHAQFRDLPRFLARGDLLVVNTSATLPAALPAAREDGTEPMLHVATRAPHMPGDRWWVVELRESQHLHPGERVDVGAGASFELAAPYAGGTRLWLARFDGDTSLPQHLARHGRPIRYSYVTERWPLEHYQTAFALAPGSAEMPSAGRPFTPELITRLVAHGTLVAPLVLHTGVSSPERHEPPYPERYEVPESTARLVNHVRAGGGRVIAVGTTVVRALESAAGFTGALRAGDGIARARIGPTHRLKIVDAILSGTHEPGTSHHELLRAFAGDRALERMASELEANGYRTHEFGDSVWIERSRAPVETWIPPYGERILTKAL